MRRPSLKAAAVSVLALVLLYLLSAWLVLPRVVQSQAEQFIAERTGHRLSMERPDFNPFNLSLRLHEVRLTQPDGAALLAFKELLVDFSATSIFRGAWVFDEIRLDQPEARIVELPGGRLNWSALLDALKGKETEAQPAAQPAAPLPRLEIASLSIAGGGIDIVDQRTQPGFATRVQPLDLHLEEFSTLPDDTGQFRLTARTKFGARLAWQGKLTVNPLAVGVRVEIDDVSLARLSEVVKLPLRMAEPEGTAGVATNYQLSLSGGQIDLVLDQIEARLAGLKLRTRPDSDPVVALDKVELKGGRFDLRRHSIAVASIELTGGGVDLARNADGRLNLMEFMPAGEEKSPPSAPTPKPAAASAPGAAPDWHYRVDRIAFSGFRAELRDRAVSPAAQLTLQDIAIAIEGVSDKWDVAWPVRASFSAGTGGKFEAQAQVIAAEPSADVQLKLVDFSLKPAQPYLGAATTLTFAGGALSAEGIARYGPRGTGFKGSVALRDLRLTEAGSRTDFLAWQSLNARKIDATPAALRVGELALVGLNTQLLIAKDRTVNLSRVVRPAPAGSAPAAAASPARGKPSYRVDIDRVRISKSEMEFADYSLALPFGTHIHHLHGTINGISSRPGAPAQLEIDGQVDEYGVASAAGQLNVFDPADFMDIRVIFRNIEMTRLTPYSATFAGRKIQSGKLSLDLDYKIKQRQLVADNKVIMEQLTLGERVDSPQAMNLPLDLAIALLQDSDGRIDLGLPVSGSLDDPQFSYGAIIWKAFVNVLTKIVTAPFRALGALFGGGETIENIAFEPGRSRLAPPQREKLVKLAAAMGKRPALALALHGTYADTDRVALQDLELRRAVAKKAGYAIDEHSDPGPVSTGQPEVQAALEDLFADRLGRGELAALKDGFRKANPGQLPESGAGRLLSRFTNAFRDKRDLSESEVAQLKGADFHFVLYERLRDKVAVGDDRLLALATARGEAALAELKAANAPSERITLLAPEKTEAAGNEVQLKLEVKPVDKAAGAPSAPAPAVQPSPGKDAPDASSVAH
jgi:uncharacterized protein involved in outer membrane biogenesis